MHLGEGTAPRCHRLSEALRPVKIVPPAKGLVGVADMLGMDKLLNRVEVPLVVDLLHKTTDQGFVGF